MKTLSILMMSAFLATSCASMKNCGGSCEKKTACCSSKECKDGQCAKDKKEKKCCADKTCTDGNCKKS